MISDLKSWIISRLHFTFETIFWFWFTNKIHIFPNYPRNCRIWSVFFSSIEWNHSFLGLWGRIIDKWHIIRIIRKDENGIFTDIRVTSFFLRQLGPMVLFDVNFSWKNSHYIFSSWGMDSIYFYCKCSFWMWIYQRYYYYFLSSFILIRFLIGLIGNWFYRMLELNIDYQVICEEIMFP